MESSALNDLSVNLSWGDVAVDSRFSPSIVRIHLKCSQCDQFGKGIDVVGRTDSLICPVAPMMAYFSLRQHAAGAFFINEQKAPVTKSWFVQEIRCHFCTRYISKERLLST